MTQLPLINVELEKNNIVQFIQQTLSKEHFNNVVVGVSGGIDSATVVRLLAKSIDPSSLYPAHLYYFDKHRDLFEKAIADLHIPEKNISLLSIKKPVDKLRDVLKIDKDSDLDKVRLGNVMARVRMITLFDLAKRLNSLVCGTENKSEHLLGYYTRFGDAASDMEPIVHLYKAQIYALAQHMGVPSEIIEQKPTAGLWEDQTDEGQFGFSYKEADSVLYLYFEKKKSIQEIQAMDFPNAQKIISFCKANGFKLKVPYTYTASI